MPETLPALRILQIYKKQLQKLWSFLTKYVRCCLRLTQLTETDSIEPAIKMGTCFIEGFRPENYPHFPVWHWKVPSLNLLTVSGSQDGDGGTGTGFSLNLSCCCTQSGTGETRITKNLLTSSEEPEHRAPSIPPWAAAEEDNRLRREQGRPDRAQAFEHSSDTWANLQWPWTNHLSSLLSSSLSAEKGY